MKATTITIPELPQCDFLCKPVWYKHKGSKPYRCSFKARQIVASPDWMAARQVCNRHAKVLLKGRQ